MGDSNPTLWEREGTTCSKIRTTLQAPGYSLIIILSTSLTQNDLWSSVMTRRDDGGVVLMVKGGAAKVDQPHCGIFYSPLITLLEEDRKETSQQFSQI